MDCRFSKDDIALAMNHVDQSNAVTDIYLKKDWSIIDQVQRGVIDFVFEKNRPDRLSNEGYKLSVILFLSSFSLSFLWYNSMNVIFCSSAK